ncbi:MAG: signal recognition particle-docking protein FtsY [Candidatus Gastranaerophilales bacterium]|nr:signal recognition particle-docking protein FtsY [Candidatus Gastranaerophilales bacterium]
MFDFFKKDNKKSSKEENKNSFFGISVDNLKSAVSKTTENLVSNISNLVQDKEELDEDLLDEIEETLIKADVGVDTAIDIVEQLREKQIGPSRITDFLKKEFKNILSSSGTQTLNIKENQQNIILVTGVNGAGKTTLIGKLAHRFKNQGKWVLIAAGDTFRAAAEDQLEIWSERAGANIIRRAGADPASVVFDAIKTLKEYNSDILIIDTAGRLQNKINLMEELGKIKRVIDKEAPGLLTESILVIDANTGQNGLQQAKIFKEAVDITSVGLTKLDGSAKGGIVLAIAKELNLPVKLVGVGEKMEDLKDFNAEDFISALFD